MLLPFLTLLPPSSYLVLTLCSLAFHLSPLFVRLPAQSFERVVMSVIFSVGAAAGFYGGDVLRLVDDLQALRPTLFASVPRLFNRIYDKITHAIESKRRQAIILLFIFII